MIIKCPYAAVLALDELNDAIGVWEISVEEVGVGVGDGKDVGGWVHYDLCYSSENNNISYYNS